MAEVTELGATPRNKSPGNGGKSRTPKVAPETQPDEPLDLTQLATKIAASIGGELLLYNGPINEDGFGQLLELIPSLMRSRHRGCMLALVTNGGHAPQAYRMARLMQDVFEPFIVFVPGACKSAGTLLATGAHKLIIAPHLGELGPLDVQLYKCDELGEIRSGLVTRSAIDGLGEHAFELYSSFMMEIKERSGNLIRFRTATDVAARMASALISEVYKKIDPDDLGDEYRDMQVALNYACRLAKKGKNIDRANIHHLVYNYPSHDFFIDFDEASGIFRLVEPASLPLMRLVAALGSDVVVSTRTVTVKSLSKPASDVAADPGGSDAEDPEGQASDEDAAD